MDNPTRVTIAVAIDSLDPWKLVVYMYKFGEQAYFVNIPSKFISADGRTVWLCYSANFKGHQIQNPPESGYGLTLHEVKLLP